MAVRKLAAIMFTDIAGYTALMQQSEGTAIVIRNQHRAIFQPLTTKYHGRIIQYYGDGTLSIFESTSEAVRCAYQLQEQFRKADIPVRIGIHTGDIVITEDDIIGDSVNLASRIESLGVPGAVLFSGKVMEEIKNQDDLEFGLLGSFHFKNDGRSREVYALRMPGVVFPNKKDLHGKLETPAPNWRNRIILAAGSLVVILGLLFGYFKWQRGSGLEQLALLPFLTVQNSQEHQALVDGVHDDMLSYLQQSGLEIKGRVSVLRYREAQDSYASIAKELGVDGILTGSIFRLDDTLGLVITLIDGSNGEETWSRSYVTDFQYISRLYGQITKEIFKAARISTPAGISIKPEEREVNPEAYKAYLQGLQYWYKLTPADLETAMKYFELSKSKDPDYGPAYAGIMAVWGGRLQQGYIGFAEVATELIRAITTAEELGANLPEVQFWKAIFSTWYLWDWDAAEQAYSKTLKLNPNFGDAHAYYAHFLCITGRKNDAIRHMEKAIELDPFNPLFKALYGMVLNFSGQYDQVIDLLANALDHNSYDPIAISTLRTTYHLTGQYNQAIDVWRRYFEARKDSVALETLQSSFAQAGYHFALENLARLQVERSKAVYVPAWQIATLFTRAGNKDQALEWLQKAYREHDSNMPYISTDSIFNPIRKDKRFKDLLEKMELNRSAFKG